MDGNFKILGSENTGNMTVFVYNAWCNRPCCLENLHQDKTTFYDKSQWLEIVSQSLLPTYSFTTKKSWLYPKMIKSEMRLFWRDFPTVWKAKYFNVWNHDIWCCSVATPDVTLIMNAAASKLQKFLTKEFKSRNQTETQSQVLFPKQFSTFQHRRSWNNKKCSSKLVSEIAHWMSWRHSEEEDFSKL